MIYNLDYILNDIDQKILNKDTFSIVRLGDGDIKLLKSIIYNTCNIKKFQQQGIPITEKEWITSIYKNSCTNANYISSFDVYDGIQCWRRIPRVQKKILQWKKVYQDVGITNENYCNPEIGFFLFLENRRNLFSVIEQRKICIVTCFSSVKSKLNNLGYNAQHILIPGRNSNHFSQYKKNIKYFKKYATKFDLFLVGAGSLGRGYSDCIKKSGGVSIDIGQVFDVWNNEILPPRVRPYLNYNKKNMSFNVKNEAKMFEKYI